MPLGARLSDLFPNSAGEIRLAQQRFQTQFDHTGYYYPPARLRTPSNHTVPYVHDRLPGPTHAFTSQNNQTLTIPSSPWIAQLPTPSNHTVPYVHHQLPGPTHAFASQNNQTLTQSISFDVEVDNEYSGSDSDDEIFELSFQAGSGRVDRPKEIQLTSSSFVQSELDSTLPTCCVCLCEIENGGSVWKCAACSNFIHFPCAEEWAKVGANCPLCRAVVS